MLNNLSPVPVKETLIVTPWGSDTIGTYERSMLLRYLYGHLSRRDCRAMLVSNGIKPRIVISLLWIVEGRDTPRVSVYTGRSI
jgi:hypothetical protein